MSKKAGRKNARAKTDTGKGGQRLGVVVLAAGLGKRMRSQRAKVLHEIAGRPLLSHVLSAVGRLSAERCVTVVGYQADEVGALAAKHGAICALQSEQLGTGHAVAQAKSALGRFRGNVLVLVGDAPLITTSTLRKLVSGHRRRGALATVLTTFAENPAGYGRIVRDDKGGISIVEHRDASRMQREIDEVNTGIYCFDSAFLFRSLASLNRDNVQGEYYLTDVMAAASHRGKASSVVIEDECEALGVDSRLGLARAEALMQERLILGWMEKGVTFLDPSSVYLSADTTIGRDTRVGPGLRTRGTTKIGRGVVIDGNAYLADTSVGSGSHVRWGVVADGARIGRNARVGPYSHLRPEADLGDEVHVGNFVEIKKSTIGRGSKANHLAYIGDANVGRGVNVGAGTITCNYDGFAKHRTVIEDGVQIGSDTQLVAPVRLGRGSYVAAGSTVTSDVEADALVFNDKRQRVRPGWARRFRKRAGAKGKKK